MAAPSLKLNNGMEYPQLGFGTFASAASEAKESVVKAIQCGYRHLDCAAAYISFLPEPTWWIGSPVSLIAGVHNNEELVGEAIRECVPSICSRADLKVTTKLWVTNMDPEKVEPACRLSLKKLGLDYIDLYLIHWPMKQVVKDPSKPGEAESITYSQEWFIPTWRAMEALVEKGLVRAIGVCNCNLKKMKEIVSFSKVRPAMLQIELHPELTQKKLVDYCHSQGIQVTAFSPLGNAKFHPEGKAEPLKQPVVLTLAQKHGKTPAQMGIIAIPKSVTPSRIEENIRIFDFTLSDADMKEIAALECNGRIFDGSFLFPTNPKSAETLWDEKE